MMSETRQPRIGFGAQPAAGFRRAIEREGAQSGAREVRLRDEGVVTGAEEKGVVVRHGDGNPGSYFATSRVSRQGVRAGTLKFNLRAASVIVTSPRESTAPPSAVKRHP